MVKNVKKTVTQFDVAKEAGVTRSMVSYVLTGSTERSVAPETKQKILDAIDKLGYRPNKAAQALQQGEEALAEKQIGVVLCDANVFLRPYYAEIISGIHIAAHENSYHVRFIRFFEELKNPILFNELIHPEEIGGLILVSTDQCIKTDDDKKIIERIKERIQKIVCVEWKCDGLSSVHFDRQETAKKATEHLFKKGYEDIAYIGEVDDRILGVKQALSEHKKNTEKLYVGEAFNMPGGYSAIKKLNKSGKKLPRAIVCGSDEVAIGVMCYLNEEKISIPNDVALISIDNIEVSGYTNPPLTTMNVQKTAMGSRAVEMIVNGSAGQGKDAITISLPTNIVERKSC
ncbi:MAG: LacI family DNA-binding transcriptional regulator [Treponema sp.]